jgi:hypothetical protein
MGHAKWVGAKAQPFWPGLSMTQMGCVGPKPDRSYVYGVFVFSIFIIFISF